MTPLVSPERSASTLGAAPARPVTVVKVTKSGAQAQPDVAAPEEPLEIRLQGTSFVVTMRTPGADRELAAGFLLAERIIDSAGDVRSIRHCLDTPEVGNVLDVMLTGDAASRLERVLAARRLVVATSACGVCGRRSIEDLMEQAPRVTGELRVTAAAVSAMSERLRRSQAVFDETGGLHAAALFDETGAVIEVAEDVGRHNAVDKVIGAQLLAGHVPLSSRVLFVSGRTSFEIVQKAVVAGIPIVAAVSAPSSLAIELAADAGVTLIGFVRGGMLNIYAGKERVSL